MFKKIVIAGLCLNPILVYADNTNTNNPPPPPPMNLNPAEIETKKIDILPEQKNEIEPKINLKQIEKNQEFTKTKKSDSDTLHINAEELEKQPELLQRAFFSSIQTHNIQAMKLLLPLYEKQENHDVIAVHLAKGHVAKSEAQYKKAVKEYKQVLENNKDFAEAKIALAQTYFENHQNISAEKSFTELKNQTNLPNNVHQLSDAYLQELKNRRKFNWNIGANYTQDKNINNAPNDLNPRGWTLSPREKAHGISYFASAEKSKPIADNWSIRTQGNLYGKFYWDNHDYDDITTRISVGTAYQTARAEASIMPYFERRWYSTKKYSKEMGVSLNGSYWINPKNQVLASAEWGKQKHDSRKHLDGKVATASATWLHVFNPRHYWTFGVDMSRKSADDLSSAYRRRGARVGVNYRFLNGLGTNFSAGIGRRVYDDAIIFNQEKRVDKDYYASVGLSHQKIQVWKVQPRLVFQWQKSKSTHPFYGTYSKKNVFIQFNKSF